MLNPLAQGNPSSVSDCIIAIVMGTATPDLWSDSACGIIVEPKTEIEEIKQEKPPA